MKIVDRWKDLVHTHFVTDAVRLSAERTRDIERAFGEVLRGKGIVFGTHFAHGRHEPGIRIVLEFGPTAVPSCRAMISIDGEGLGIDKGHIDALAVGGKVTMPVQDTFWGAKFGMLTDAYGISWMFNGRLQPR